MPAQPGSNEGAHGGPSVADHSPDNPAGDGPQPGSKPLEVHIVGTDEAKSQARDAAERRLESELSELSRRQIFSRIWKSNVGREFLLARYERDAEADIREAGNLYVHDEDGATDRDHHERALLATLARFTSEYDELVHSEAGEVKHELESDAEADFANQVKGLVGGLATGSLSMEAFNEGRARLVGELEQTHPELAEQGSLYADNLAAIAEQVRVRVESGEELERILAETKVYVDRAKTGVRTEVHATRVDKTLDWLKEHHMSLANEQTMVAAVSLAYSVGRWSARTATGAAMRMAVPVGAAGIWAGVRENHRLKEERRQHSRDMAQGRDFDPNSERRAEIDETRYESREANELLEQLYGACLEQDTENGGWRLRDFTPEQFAAAVAVVAEIAARRQLSDAEQVDLISFSDVKTVEAERLELDLRVAQAKVGLQRYLSQGDAAWREQFIEGGVSVEELIRLQADTAMEATRADMTEKDRAFASMKRSHVAAAVAKGVLAGAGFGVVAQEISAMVRSDQVGAVESLWQEHTPDGAHQTLLRGWLHDGAEVRGLQPVAVVDDVNAVRLAGGMNLERSGDGTYLLLDDGRELARGLRFDEQGLDQASESTLRGLGASVTTERVSVSEAVWKTVSPDEYVESHKGDLAAVHRTLWYDQNTPGTYDRNELGLHWGGQAGVDASGNYVMSAASMEGDGSWHEGLSANARELAARGELRLQLSLSEATQAQVFTVPIDVNGNAVIASDSAAGRLLFDSTGGQAQFLGRYAEVAQVLGQQDGVEQVRLLATYEGEGLSSVQDTVNGSRDRFLTSLELARPEPLVDVPPVLPVYSRRGLEPSSTAENGEQSGPQGPGPEGGQPARVEENQPPVTTAPVDPSSRPAPSPSSPRPSSPTPSTSSPPLPPPATSPSTASGTTRSAGVQPGEKERKNPSNHCSHCTR